MWIKKGLDFEMTPEIMEQLQQHAIDRFGPEDRIGRMRFIQGAEAAWDLSLKNAIDPNSFAEKIRSEFTPTEDELRCAAHSDFPPSGVCTCEKAAVEYALTHEELMTCGPAHADYRKRKEAFLAGRRGLREAVELAVKAERKRCHDRVDLGIERNDVVQDILDDILNPSKEDGA